MGNIFLLKHMKYLKITQKKTSEPVLFSTLLLVTLLRYGDGLIVFSGMFGWLQLPQCKGFHQNTEEIRQGTLY
jgi:hypothetical protein